MMTDERWNRSRRSATFFVFLILNRAIGLHSPFSVLMYSTLLIMAGFIRQSLFWGGGVSPVISYKIAFFPMIDGTCWLEILYIPKYLHPHWLKKKMLTKRRKCHMP
jgi:hypothetical protein